MALIGFARVSTQEQDLTLQIEQLQAYGCKKIFFGKNSGKKESNRGRLKELLDFIREGDVVVVTKLDRLGRSTSQVLSILDEFKEKNVDFKTLDGFFDTTLRDDPISRAMINIIAMFSELERSFIVTRTQEGKLAKIANGDKNAIGGRPLAIKDNILKNFAEDVKDGLSIKNLSNKYNISISTVLRYKKKIAA